MEKILMSLRVIKIMVIDFPCICGHTKYSHVWTGISIFERCDECFDGLMPYYKVCKKYIRSNLKYLEQKYEALYG